MLCSRIIILVETLKLGLGLWVGRSRRWRALSGEQPLLHRFELRPRWLLSSRAIAWADGEAVVSETYIEEFRVRLQLVVAHHVENLDAAGEGRSDEQS